MTHTPEYRRILTRMGYYDYQSRLIYRHLGQEDGWESHLANCRRFILEAMSAVKPSTVTVLGSGWLLELPLAEMLESAERIYLVDIVHPPDVISQAGAIDKISIEDQDVSGGLIGEVWEKMKAYSIFRKRRTLRDMQVPEYEPGFDTGLVISLNIITQIESQLIDFIRKRSVISEEDYSAFRQEIQERHLDFLKKRRSVLITDTAEVFSGEDGRSETVKTLLADLPHTEVSEEWKWDYDLKGADSYTRTSIMNVKALLI